ncbi:glycosyltransferase family 2 protein [Campylobacter sp. RM9344]|uniref:Glycosyltransferase family 2 protein n=1 Tax=Campylobacter californiensis TaxID=1032243 RepID=A0AAW3ZWS8_9BACT|nr:MULTISPECIES: glycosyltransferase family 2 protein [unclassified Campylobacter]MBE2985233.1 glycosyltransferase family 2 protein [Campylobacter sp. RM6883]MBE2986886.1 glycosyltransferase family 2 protein [Campylobacter sp. RM12919]MBE2988555.1 glycosyltransferase family 2 protein [Campylobacter sp. RM12920]MBE2995681.1 glycosyltransferase family 2 protein [Campylobacter sp. RM6913]MBE3029746.1 glycosyltransferase family 2 protein [Campylobacter sp. RM9344]
MNEVKISVIIPTFNRPELLKKALSSALNQTYKNLEIIVSDDANDETAKQICEKFSDKRVRYVKNKTHAKSPNGNKNNGFDNASGEFVCILDDDDELCLEAISECFSYIKEGYKCVFADGVCEIDGKITDKIAGRNPYQNSCEMSKIDYHCGRITGEYFKLFSREFIEGFRFDEKSFGGENELYIRFFENRVFYHKKPLYIYRINRADSATTNADKHAKGVAYAYLKTAKICHDIAIKHNPKFLCLQYKNAAYYAKIAGDYKLMLSCIARSFKISICKENLAFLAVCFLPNSAIKSLSNFRVWIKKRFGV